MDIVQYMCRTVEILLELGCTILVLTPKGNIDTRGIGILKTLWKVVEAIINTQLQASIQFHYVLHGFRSGRGSGMVTVDINISKQLFSINQEPLFLVLFDFRESYNTIDRRRLIRTLEGHGAGPQIFNLLATL